MAPRPLDSGNFHGGHGRLSWKRLSGVDVPRTAPQTCAGDCRGSAVSAVFSRERFQGRFSQPRISNVPVGRFILTARNSRKLPRRIGEHRCESENPAGSPGRTSPNGSIRRKLPVHHSSTPPAAAQKWQIGAEDIAYRPCRRCGRKRVRALGLCRLFSSDVETLQSLPCGRGDDNRGHTPIGGRHEASPVLLRVPASYACERAQGRIGESCNNARSSMANTPSTP